MSSRRELIRVASDANDIGSSCSSEISEVLFDTNLTTNEKRDIRAWDRRLSREKIFSKYYYPEPWEAREIVTIQRFLSITTDPRVSTVATLVKSEATNDAISFMFFPSDHSPKSVLLKRGPILLNGEEERELLIFTHGLLTSRLEFDSLINILFTINSENPELLDSEQLRERFNAVDADGSGTIEKMELKQMFLSLGVPVSDEAMENIIERFDVDGDREISFDEFQKVMHELQPTLEDKSLLGRLSHFGKKVQKQINTSLTTGDRKLDKAYLFKDIEYIESIGVSSSASTKHIANSSFKDLAFAVFPKSGNEEMIFICSKPEQRMAWMDALSTCLINSKRFGSNGAVTDSPGWQHKVIRASIFSLVVCNDIDGLRKQLRHPSTDDGIDDQDEDGKTALHYAASLDNIQCATLLLDAEANVNVLDNDGKTPMDIATQLQNSEMMDLIKGLGGEANASECLFKSAVQEREDLQKKETKESLLAGKAKKATGALSDAMNALRERGDRIEKLSHKSADLQSNAADYAANARALKEKQKKKAGMNFRW